MNDFNIELRDAMAQAGISQKKLADIIGCSRAMVYAVLNNEKRLSEKSFRKLIDESVFSGDQKRRLRLSYYSVVYDDKVIEHLRTINKYFRKESLRTLGSYTDFDSILPDKTQELIGGDHIIIALLGALKKEIKEKEHPFAVTNYSCSNRTLNNNIYDMLKNCNKEMDFNHVVYFDNCSTPGGDIASIFESFRFMALGNKVFAFYGNIDEMDMYNISFTHFLITSDCAVFFDLNDLMGVYIADKELTEIFRKRAMYRINNLPLISECYSDIMELKDSLLLTTNSLPHVAFEVYPCVCTVVDAEDFEYIIADDEQNREMLKKMAAAYFSKNLFDFNITYCVSAAGLQKFAETGIIKELPLNRTKTIPAELRKKVLRKYIEMVHCDNIKFFITDTDVIKLQDMYFGYEIYDDKMIIFSNADKNVNNAFSGSCLVSINNKKLISVFNSHVDYIDRNNLYLSENAADRFLNDLIIKCDLL